MKGSTTSAYDDRSTVRVVTVEDDPEVRALLRIIFGRSERFDLVGEADDGAGAVEVVIAQRADIVLLDLMMPGVGGHEVLPVLVEKAPETMVAVLSALSAQDQAEGTFAAGAFAYLEKSLLGPQLIEELDELYGRFQRALAGETVWVPVVRPRTRFDSGGDPDGDPRV